ncbi:hypothetical protein HID58_031685 [Brassica napus]|uniref:Uncharacterized protein n=1 Tax=Brassica napus TaxID=3708 RepID=A0ABQ8BU59_BRANA|nr:hypothetical protein HID58_031685 [Brassica napus]
MKDTCGYTTQAAYNKDRPIAQRQRYRKKKSFSFKNFSIPKTFIRDNGLHRDVSVCIYIFVFVPNKCTLNSKIYVCVGGYVWTMRDNKNVCWLIITCGSTISVCKDGNCPYWNYFRGPA